MTTNALPELSHEEWVKKVEHLRAYLKQEHEKNRSAYDEYEKALRQFNQAVDTANELCVNLRSSYSHRIEELRLAIRETEQMHRDNIQKIQRKMLLIDQQFSEKLPGSALNSRNPHQNRT